MPQNKHKVVQSFITAFNTEARIIAAAKDRLAAWKTKYQNLSPDLTGTALSTQNASDMNSYLSDLTDLCNLPIVTTIESKNIPSHDTKGLD